MTTIYTNKCPFCGTYISIEYATICPGCSSSIYYNYYYYPSQEMLDEAIKNRIAEEKYWASEEGKKRIEENLENARIRSQEKNTVPLDLKGGLAGFGLLILSSIPFVWFFGGWEWDNFGGFGWPALIFGIFFVWWGSK
jgi:hypothetical protein